MKKNNEYEDERQLLVMVNDVLLTNIDRNDRVYVKHIIRTCLTFDDSMPKLDYSFTPKDDHYNMIIRGWNQDFDIKKAYKMFLSKNRDQVCDPIRRVYCTPSPSSGRGPILTLQIDRLHWNETKKKKRSKKKK